ncbi:MAG: hypothetical protein Q9218_007033, partial [Villophora microphyllina]
MPTIPLLHYFHLIILTISTTLALTLPPSLNLDNIPSTLLVPSPTTTNLTTLTGGGSDHPLPPLSPHLIHCIGPSKTPLRPISEYSNCHAALVSILHMPDSDKKRTFTAPLTRLSGSPCTIELRKSEGKSAIKI